MERSFRPDLRRLARALVFDPFREPSRERGAPPFAWLERPVDEQLPSEDDVLQRLAVELERSSPSEREALELRFRDGLALESGPPDLAERVRAGLEALRLRMDAAVPGGRRAWAAALFPHATDAPVISGPGKGWDALERDREAGRPRGMLARARRFLHRLRQRLARSADRGHS